MNWCGQKNLDEGNLNFKRGREGQFIDKNECGVLVKRREGATVPRSVPMAFRAFGGNLD
jgi:hypothetical protein